MVTVRDNIVNTLKALGYIHGPFTMDSMESDKYRSEELRTISGSNTDWHNHILWWLPTQADGGACALADQWVKIGEFEPTTGDLTPDRPQAGAATATDRFYLIERTTPAQMIDITNRALRRNRRVGDIIFRDVSDTFQVGAYTFPIANQPGLSLHLYDGSIVPNVFESAEPGTDYGEADPDWTTSSATQVISPNGDSTGLVYSLSGLSASLNAASAYVRTVAVALPGGSQQLSAQVALRGSGRVALRIETLTSGDVPVQTVDTEYIDLDGNYWRAPQVVGLSLGATEVKARASIVSESTATVQIADLMGNTGPYPVPFVASVRTGPTFDNVNAIRDLYIAAVGSHDQRVVLQGGDVLARNDVPFIEFGHRINTGRSIIVRYKAPLAPVSALDTEIDLGVDYMIAASAVEFWFYQQGKREGAVRGEADFEYQRWIPVWNREHKMAVGVGSDIARRLRV